MTNIITNCSPFAPFDLLIFLKICAIDFEESAFRRAGGHGDTSQNGNYSNFRNVSFLQEGLEEHDARRQPLDDAGPMLVDKKFLEALPVSGLLVFDYVSTRRPGQGQEQGAASDGRGPSAIWDRNRRVNADDEWGSADEAVGLEFFCEADDVLLHLDPNPTPHPSPNPNPNPDRGTTSKYLPTDSNLTLPRPVTLPNPPTAEYLPTGSPESPQQPARTASASADHGNPNHQYHANLISDDEFLQFMTDLRLSVRDKCVPPQTMFALLYLKYACCKFYFTTARVCVLMDTFENKDAIQVCFWFVFYCTASSIMCFLLYGYIPC